MFVFRKIWRALFSLNIHFEILPFALLPKNWVWSYKYVLWALPEEKFFSLLWFRYMLWNISERKCICRTYIQQDAKQKNKGKTSTEDTFTVKKKQIWMILNAYKQWHKVCEKSPHFIASSVQGKIVHRIF